MDLTWVAILASISMALGALCIFVFAVKRNYFHNIEDAKYQVFWSEAEDCPNEPRTVARIPEDKRNVDGSSKT